MSSAASPLLVPREPDPGALEAAFDTSLSDATPETKEELRRLIRYRAPPSAHLDFPKNKLAAVLVLLHLNPLGELSVTLTTRSQRLRSHPGETALPGGRWEEGDGEGGVWTALREAHEEIGLPLPPHASIFPPPSSPSAPPPLSHLLHLTTLPPFTSRTLLVVLPIVVLLVAPAASASSSYLPQTLQASPDEVAAVFHLPLRAFLLLPPPNSPPTRTRGTRSSRPAPGTETLTHTHQDFLWLLHRPYRLHSFSSPVPGVTPSAVTGLTADIVVECGVIARGRGEGELGFERRASGQMGWEETVRVAMGMSGRKGLGEEVDAGGEGEGAEDGAGAGLPRVPELET
ncbi:hypothetical protein JCM10450v2_006857 [Rhodotorula kratochvilovae]